MPHPSCLPSAVLPERLLRVRQRTQVPEARPSAGDHCCVLCKRRGRVQVTTAVLVREPEPEAKEEQRPPIDLSRASVRVVVTDTQSGKVKLETRIPSRFLDPAAMVIPQLVRLISFPSLLTTT